MLSGNTNRDLYITQALHHYHVFQTCFLDGIGDNYGVVIKAVVQLTHCFDICLWRFASVPVKRENYEAIQHLDVEIIFNGISIEWFVKFLLDEWFKGAFSKRTCEMKTETLIWVWFPRLCETGTMVWVMKKTRLKNVIVM